MSDEQIRAAHVGKLVEHSAPIVLAEYDPAWPHQFQVVATAVRNALGNRVCDLEHVGSTSVPGLAAKPKIDVLLAVPDSSNESEYVPDLEAAGFVLQIREPEWYQHRMFKAPGLGFDVNLHVFSDGCVEIARMLRFRDHLRRNPDDRQTYERAKRELAARTWKYVQNYADAKGSMVREILSRVGAGTDSY